MEWLNDFKEKYSKRRIRNLDRKEEYSRDFVDIESAKRIGIIINMNAISPDDLSLLKNYIDALKKRKKKLLIIEINFNKKSESEFPSEPDTVFINPSKLNWLDYPTPSVESQIRKFDLDILMDFDFSTRMTSKIICSFAKAKTRTGVHREGFESCYELMINHGEEQHMKAIIKEFDYFLNMIDNGNKVKV
ncbi:MAG: hypothetical protein KDE26_03580 [Bacteroidetes bacterium]|nr:hypothetical protein [Bacteroidota bacterium]MCB0842330.1 hypothetical protein [Bacteroidota bacterium]